MDGLTFVQEVRKRDLQVPIVMVTCANGEEQVLAAVDSGVNDYLIKPFPPAEVRKKALRGYLPSRGKWAKRNPMRPARAFNVAAPGGWHDRLTKEAWSAGLTDVG